MRVGFLVAALLVAPASASAGGAVLEAHAGARPADADALLAPVVAELTAAGFSSPRATAAAIERSGSRPGRAGRPAELDAAVRRIDDGYRRVVEGDFAHALTELDAGLAVLRGAPASVAGNERLRLAVLRALVGRALSFHRLGRADDAGAAMAELVRGFPDREISYKEYGPEPRDLHARVRGELAAAGRASLTIEVDDPRTVIFLDDRYVGAGSATLTGLYPGEYRVHLQQAGRPGRVHAVALRPGAAVARSLSWALDVALRTDDGIAMLARELGADDPIERLAAPVARLLRAPAVVVLGVARRGPRRVLVGWRIAADGTIARSGQVDLAPTGRPARLRALGRTLAGFDDARALVDPIPVPEGARRFGGWTWLTGAVGVAAVGTGVALIVLDANEFEDGDRNDVVRNTAPAGVATLAGGAVLLGVATAMFIHDARAADRERPTVGLAPRPGGAVLGVSGSF